MTETVSKEHSNFTQKDVDELHRVFVSFDRSKTGDITPKDLQMVLKDLAGRVVSDKEAEHMLSFIDKSGKINYESFMKMMESSRRSTIRYNKEEEMRQAFKVFDKDGNGFIDKKELQATMKTLGENLSDQDILAMIKTADKNGDGKIDYEEFIRMMYS